jgi:acetylornithine deacetylase
MLDRGFDQGLIELLEVERDVLDRITKDAWLSLAAELIATGQPDACNPLDPDMPSSSEEKIANRVVAYLRPIGFDTELVAAEPGRRGRGWMLGGRGSMAASLIGKLPGPSLTCDKS